MFRSLKKIINIYMLYIQPLLGLYLLIYWLWLMNTPYEPICFGEICEKSIVDELMPFLCFLFGAAIIIEWYFFALQPKLSEKNKLLKPKTGVKPEDFVK
ncbi:hypothetical protein DRI08_22645 [Salmonella enterica]|nr:hypothetical protein [Salmonella enterica]EBO0675577.1 hypothetical protein [Salmonella enterica]